MSPTIFSSTQEEKKKRQQELEKELKNIQQEYQQNSTKNNQSKNKKNESKGKVSTLDEPNKLDDFESTDSSEKTIEKTIQREPEDYSEVMRHENPTTNPLASFVVRPPGAKFVNQHSQEKILLVLRQHAVVNLKWIFITIILMLIPFVILPIFPVLQYLPNSYHFFILVGWYLLVTAYVVESFLYWYFNIYIITDERIIDVDFISMIYRSVSEAKLDKIEDVTAATTGVLAAVFNYGTVTIQTAAEKREFEFFHVPQPAKVTKFLNELIIEEEREKLEGRVI